MRKILEELYHGNLSVDERIIRAGSKYARALAEVAKIEEAIYERLPEKDHALLRDYALASAQLANVSMVEDFITGFRMGAQIMMAVLLPDRLNISENAAACEFSEPMMPILNIGFVLLSASCRRPAIWASGSGDALPR